MHRWVSPTLLYAHKIAAYIAKKRFVPLPFDALRFMFLGYFDLGPPEYCVEHLLKLNALGIERFVIVGPGYHPEACQGAGSLFFTEVVPVVRAALSAAGSRPARF
jgi:hypothetical protein